ncbi:hypothetical protein K7X86_00390, partial [Candidatus Sulcia muelleri]|nr:hypothetical protein [Candidatus Karelsulcia muelleri]
LPSLFRSLHPITCLNIKRIVNKKYIFGVNNTYNLEEEEEEEEEKVDIERDKYLSRDSREEENDKGKEMEIDSSGYS